MHFSTLLVASCVGQALARSIPAQSVERRDDVELCSTAQNAYRNSFADPMRAKLLLAMKTNDSELWNQYFGASDPSVVSGFYNLTSQNGIAFGCINDTSSSACANGRLVSTNGLSLCPAFFAPATHINGCDEPAAFPDATVGSPELAFLQALVIAETNASELFSSELNQQLNAPSWFGADAGPANAFPNGTACDTFTCVSALAAQSKANPKTEFLPQWFVAPYVLYAQAVWGHHASNCTTGSPQ